MGKMWKDVLVDSEILKNVFDSLFRLSERWNRTTDISNETKLIGDPTRSLWKLRWGMGSF